MIGGARMRRTLRGVVSASVAAALVLAATPAWACTQVYFGPEATANGSVIYGRSEDYAPRYPKQFGVEPQTSGKVYWSAENGAAQDPSLNFTRTAPGETYRYTYVRDLPAYWEGASGAYSEAGVNEAGVSVDATVSLEGNAEVAAIDPLVVNGLGEYSIVDVVLSEASTAREGVELLGSIIDGQGTQECASLIIADAEEAWHFWQLSGHQWLAVRVPGNVVGLSANIERLTCMVDLGDEDGCLHSAGLREVAEAAGTLAGTDDVIDVGKSYLLQEEEPSNYSRYAQGRLALGEPLEPGISYEVDEAGAIASMENAPLLFVPSRSDYDLSDAMRVLRTRGEGTQFDTSVNDAAYPVANPTVVESHLFEVRPGLDPQLATVEWLSLSPSEFALYVPCYGALVTEVDPGLYPDADAFDLGHAIDVIEEGSAEQAALQSGTNPVLNYLLMDINILAQAHREQVGTGVHAYLDTLQAEVIAQQDEVDELLRSSVPETDRTEFANEAHACVSRQVYEHGASLLEDLRAYLQAGSFAEQFVPAGLDETGQLVEPLTYADEMRGFGSGATEAAEDAAAAGASVVDEAPVDEPALQGDLQLPTPVKYVLCVVGIVVEAAIALALHKARHK